jgi:hypothetical protein
MPRPFKIKHLRPPLPYPNLATVDVFVAAEILKFQQLQPDRKINQRLLEEAD